jgi:NAD(P)-dependent dehydrogenase (short-subunit alcohol dehydrogenase family)
MAVALVTGGSRGLGKAVVREFEDRGWVVLCPSRNELDLAKAESIKSYCDGVASVGPLGALVHSAGVNWPRPLGQTCEEEWQATLQVNITAFRQLLQGLASQLVGGRVVAMGSILGLVSRTNRSAYSASKAGLLGLIRALSIELASQHTLINAVCPGYIDTDMTRQNNSEKQLAEIASSIPLGRLGTPEEVAKITYWLCSVENTYVTGQGFVIDGGFTCL